MAESTPLDGITPPSAPPTTPPPPTELAVEPVEPASGPTTQSSFEPKTESVLDPAVKDTAVRGSTTLDKAEEFALPAKEPERASEPVAAEKGATTPPKADVDALSQPSNDKAPGAAEGDLHADVNKGGQQDSKANTTQDSSSLLWGDGDQSIANSRSAQLLKNRFSTWREKTTENAQTFLSKNPAIRENAKALWMQAPNLPAVTRLAAMASATGMAKGPTEGNAAKNAEGASTTSSQKQSSLSSPDSGFVSGSNIAENDDERDKELVVSAPNDNPDATFNTTGTKTEEAPRVIVGAAVMKAATAASVVAESVATNFIGRYSAKAPSAPEPPPPDASSGKVTPESQTALILKSRVAKHMQDILDGLDEHEFAMLLGPGMLGVNLKQCYLKNHGVFVDFLVGGGQAQSSGVIRTGDLLVRVGDTDLRKGTITEIPQTIAASRRPVVLILGTGTKVSLERLNYIDVSVSIMHRARAYYNEKRKLTPLDKQEGQKSTKQEGSGAEPSDVSKHSTGAKFAASGQEGSGEVTGDPTPYSVSNVAISSEDSIQSFVTPPILTLSVRKEFFGESALRYVRPVLVDVDTGYTHLTSCF
jgi:hypothetical protein